MDRMPGRDMDVHRVGFKKAKTVRVESYYRCGVCGFRFGDAGGGEGPVFPDPPGPEATPKRLAVLRRWRELHPLMKQGRPTGIDYQPEGAAWVPRVYRFSGAEG